MISITYTFPTLGNSVSSRSFKASSHCQPNPLVGGPLVLLGANQTFGEGKKVRSKPI